MKLQRLILVIPFLLTILTAIPVATYGEDYGIGQYRGSWGVKPVTPSDKVPKSEPPAQDAWKGVEQSRGSWLDGLLEKLGKWIGADDWGKKDDASTKTKTLTDDQILRAKDNAKTQPVDNKKWEKFMEGGSAYPGAKMQGATKQGGAKQ